MKYFLSDWKIKIKDLPEMDAKAPCSVISSLIEYGVIDNPYIFDNEEKARKFLYNDAVFVTKFSLKNTEILKNNYLVFEGIDTVARIYLNGVEIKYVNDMHRTYRIKLDSSLLKEDNILTLNFTSPYTYIDSYKYEQNFFETFAVTEKNSPVLRKANYMFGWDWGINLADIGLFRDCYIISTDVGFIKDYKISSDIDKNFAKLNVEVNSEVLSDTKLSIKVGFKGQEVYSSSELLKDKTTFNFNVEDPRLWYPTGFGEQPLYDIEFEVESPTENFSEKHKFGIRKVDIDTSFDSIGRNFAVYINGKKVFLKGSNYIPMDCILPRINRDRTYRLLKLCKDFNHNVIRVWGGGLYPDDYFYEICDELGILVWQDLMFACASYDINDSDFKNNITEETIDNLRRIRNHPSLFIISGNNEIEDGVRGHGFVPAVNYVDIFEKLLKDITEKETDIFYLPSSPTSGSPIFASPNDMAFLDVHYWPDVSQKIDLSVYGRIVPRLLSEFGYQAYPCFSSIKKYIQLNELYVNSPTIKLHQKKPNSDDVIPYYVNEYYKKPESMEEFVYYSQLVQAEVIKMCVEHMRVNKPRCNGAIYWQLNDDWYSQSWSSIDYDFGVKALHYYSRKFFSPDLVVIEKDNDGNACVSVSNDTDTNKDYILKYYTMLFDGTIVDSSQFDITIDAYSSKTIIKDCHLNIDNNSFVYAELYDSKGCLLSDNYLQAVADKYIDYIKPNFSVREIDDNSIGITADTFSKRVFIDAGDNDIVLSDNFFNLIKGKEKVIYFSKKANLKKLKILSVR